ncbi:MAG: protein jag [Oscillospiraceae bacterium]|nr:protein jag [Oscillospiraceae bacterium]
MTKFIEVSAKTEEEAVQSALNQLGLTRDDVSVEIIERAKSGFLGLKSTPAVVRVIYEVNESRAERVERFLSGLFVKMDIDASQEIFDEGDTISVVITGGDPGALIGRRGETLDAMQHLTNYVINKGAADRVRVNLDTENYRDRRNETLENLANKVARKVIKYRRNITLDPMNAYERHVIHTALQNYENVTTYSVGNEPNRRIVVAFGRRNERQDRDDRRGSRPPDRRNDRRSAPVPQQDTSDNSISNNDSTSQYREWS